MKNNLPRWANLLIAFGGMIGLGLVVTYVKNFPPAMATTAAGFLGMIVDTSPDTEAPK